MSSRTRTNARRPERSPSTSEETAENAAESAVDGPEDTDALGGTLADLPPVRTAFGALYELVEHAAQSHGANAHTDRLLAVAREAIIEIDI